MFIKTSQLLNWHDLQNIVAQLFTEMDYEVELEKTIKLAGRGSKKIDVFVSDPNASFNRIYLIECKYWNNRIPQDVVHSFKTIMEESGANTGLIISKKGFQPGARSAARYTNMKILTFEELQNLYGNEWFRKQKAKLQSEINSLNEILNLHFTENIGIMNNVCFHTEKMKTTLTHFYMRIAQLVVACNIETLKSYLGPEPVKLASDPFHPLDKKPGWYYFKTVRDYFSGMRRAAHQCVNDFTSFYLKATKSFERLPISKQKELFNKAFECVVQELPLIVFREHLSDIEYKKLIKNI